MWQDYSAIDFTLPRNRANARQNGLLCLSLDHGPKLDFEAQQGVAEAFSMCVQGQRARNTLIGRAV